jgi:hypothetical protein
MKKVFFASILSIVFTLFSCQNDAVSPDDSIEGAFKAINNPVLCTTPTMGDVVIKTKGRGYSISFVNLSTTTKETLSGFELEKTDSTSKVLYKGSEVGTFGSMKYTEYSGSNFETKEGWVLMLRFENDKKHYEFMGRK